MRFREWLRVGLLTLCFTPGVASAQEAGAPAAIIDAQGTLALQVTQERDLTRGQAHSWSLDTQAGQYIEVLVEEDGVRVLVRLRDPEGRVQYDGELAWQFEGGIVPLLRWAIDTSGLWTVEVVPINGEERLGHYRITWLEERALDAGGEPLVEADRLTREAWALQRGAPGRRQMLERALAIREEVQGHEHPEIATALIKLVGRSNWPLSEAIPIAERAMAIAERSFSPETAPIAVYSNVLANMYFRAGRYEEAAVLTLRELAINQVLYGPDGAALRWAVGNLAGIYSATSRLEEAELAYRRAIEIQEKSFGIDYPNLPPILTQLANVLTNQGRFSEAEQILQRALDIQERTQIINPRCSCINGLGRLYASQGRYAEAEPLYRRANSIVEEALGSENIYAARGDANLALLFVEQQRFDEADPLAQRALAILETINGPDAPSTARVLGLLGRIRADQGRHAEAEPFYEREIAILEKVFGPDHPDVAAALLRFSRSRLDTGQNVREMLDRTIAILDQTPGKPIEHLSAYVLRAELSKKEGDLEGAIYDLEEALLLAEELRPQASGGEVTRAEFFEQFSDLYDRMVAWQIESDDIAAALEYAERGRSRVLLDQFFAGQIDIRDGIPAEERPRLDAKEARAALRLAEFQQQLTYTRGRADLEGEERLALIQAAGDSLRAADAEYTAVYNEIKNASTLWKNVITSGGKPVTLRDIQRKLLDRGETLLVYEVGTEASFVFVIGSSGAAEAIPLTIPADAAQVLGVEAGPLTEPVLRKMLGDSDGAAGMIAQLSTRGARVSGRAGFSAPERLHALWQTLVPEDLWPRLVASQSVVLIPDAMLHMLPFEALVTSGEGDVRYWLDDGPVIRYAPSATVLHQITVRPNARVTEVAGAPVMLSLSDPIYNPLEVAEAEEGGTRSAGSARTADRSSFERAGGSLVRLPGTALETDVIAGALSGREAMVTLQGLEATETNLRAAVQDKRYLHLATHGIVDASRGELFASLVMTPPSGLEATIDNDGYLSLAEIYDLELEATELAVLSACESNVGPEVEGEGVFALSRGFLAAGARRVVASQWAVDDASTAELVGGFFASVLEEKAPGATTDYGLALRDAKRLVRDQDQWSDPYYWAPFILAGKQ